MWVSFLCEDKWGKFEEEVDYVGPPAVREISLKLGNGVRELY